jgi:hypothetical protein
MTHSPATNSRSPTRGSPGPDRERSLAIGRSQGARRSPRARPDPEGLVEMAARPVHPSRRPLRPGARPGSHAPPCAAHVSDQPRAQRPPMLRRPRSLPRASSPPASTPAVSDRLSDIIERRSDERQFQVGSPLSSPAHVFSNVDARTRRSKRFAAGPADSRR